VVQKGCVLRIIAHEGKQVADVRFMNRSDYREQFDGRLSTSLSLVEGYGKLTRLYSKPPWQNLMLTIIDDKVGKHFMNGQCTPKTYEMRGKPGHRSCAQNFDECLNNYYLSMRDLDSAGVFNVWMPPPIYDKDGIKLFPPACEKGDYIDFLAEMDVLTAISACPDDSVVNDYQPKSLKVQVMEKLSVSNGAYSPEVS